MAVGDGHDYSAEVAGTITNATGSFDVLSPKITEKGQVDHHGPKLANTFTLQLNTAPFSTEVCSGSSRPANCSGWQQFVYEMDSNTVYMQYWLLNYDTTCPSSPMIWYAYKPSANTIDCYGNSPASTYPARALTAADLAISMFEGSAVSGGNDEVSLSSESGQATLIANSDSVLDLATSWNTAEFGVFGDAGGSEAYFGAKTTLEALTTLDSNSQSAPQCLPEGFTGETNNLKLTGTPALGSQPSPTIASEQTNGKARAASCAVGS